GQLQAASATSEAGLKAFPKEQRLLVLRRQIRSDLARTQTKNPENNPAEAERHFATGVQHYFARRYAAAEKDLLQASRTHNQDARYLYFLGRARPAQNRRDGAVEDSPRGPLLKAKNKPHRRVVSESLERIQGPAGQILTQARR